jgi:hypothetical protein
MNTKGCGRKQPWCNLRYHLGTCLKELNETTKISRYSVSVERFEPGTSQIRSRSANHSAASFSELERMWKEAVEVGFEELPNSCLERLRKTKNV